VEKYCESRTETVRFPSREVMVGNVGIGGSNPIRIQSMTTTPTHDIPATIDQVMRLADSGCEIARITVQGKKEAFACEGIKNGLVKRGYLIPLVADIHFYPPAAMTVVDFVDKVRVNPGNFVDRRASFKEIEYTDETYHKELEKIEKKFAPLIEKCKSLKKALRIGTNHGSLSDRIMNRYGDTAYGMVESALEFARVCRKYDFHDFVFSMKSSNTHVMIEAYRLLIATMYRENWDYPLHLGVTEAGEGEDGRVKSAIGIGALLLDGLGDTLRVSLTEDPWHELDPCRRLIAMAQQYKTIAGKTSIVIPSRKKSDIQRSATTKLPFMHRQSSVVLSVTEEDIEAEGFFETLGCSYNGETLSKALMSVDAVIVTSKVSGSVALEKIAALQKANIGVISSFTLSGAIPLLSVNDEYSSEEKNCAVTIQTQDRNEWQQMLALMPSLIILAPANDHFHNTRNFFAWLAKQSVDIPVILSLSSDLSEEDMVIRASAVCGSLLCDGFGKGLHIKSLFGIDFDRKLSLNILQGSRKRISKTEFMSCPGCGRTLFNLQDVAKRIRERTAHLSGVKIAIMGCIVNGPGEMADADFGYVGSNPGKIDLYVGKNRVEKNIDFEEADDRLVALIKAHGRWREPHLAELAMT